jgi:hypothetical protein
MKTQPNDPVVQSEKWAEAGNDGLTKREYFAAMAMQGLLSFPRDPSNVDKNNVGGIFAKSAVKFADALIKELNNELNT